ncbi:radical SAM protein [Nostoc flagelliforme FACHB-838]|uniref:Radical SAM protein n=1 Tax=Nostoc flagelliforme FACHB-838 TaxID=2692904 RepID=A0ABR8DQR1_9NOSO|nr:radical SAM protein [Nostoc flagelliforme]MBD2531102.1 radical SAM protein [Nostoc flagelliforme FACHB-838]
MKHPDTELRLFKSVIGSHLFVVDGSRIYDLAPEVANRLEQSWSEVDSFPLDSFSQYIDGQPLTPPPLASISLNVAQACNMSCSYCYADTGKFGGHARLMSLDVAKATVDRLIAESDPTVGLVIGYMGGEPLLNRRVVHETTRYAAQAAQAANRQMRFSITTNGTLLQKEDAELFAEFPFTVAISVDGNREQNDAIRAMNNGSSSYECLQKGLALLNRYGKPRHLAARITVTPKTGELLPILDHVISLGFDEVGFAVVLVSPDPSLAFALEDFTLLLQQAIACGQKALQQIKAGSSYPFSNFEIALQEIHRGSHRPYPCGAGAAYLSTNAEGKLFACHRLIDDPQFAMGSIWEGSDMQARANHLTRNHVDYIEPCKGCWARYLCGGGCYHEVSRRGRIGCDYIRGWLDFCLSAYVELSTIRPEYFNQQINLTEHSYGGFYE